MRVYISFLVVALVAFALLALLVHGQDRLLWLDRQIAEAIQSIHFLPLYGWILTQYERSGVRTAQSGCLCRDWRGLSGSRFAP